MTFNKRVTIVDEWAVTEDEEGTQTRARLAVDPDPMEPERGEGLWNNGVTMYRIEDNYRGTDLDEYEPMENIMSIIENGEDRNRDYRDDEPWMRDVDQVCRYLRIFHGAQFAEIMTHRYDRYVSHILVIVEGIEEGADAEAIARGTFKEWDAWASNEVYMVESQSRTLLEAMDDPEWEYDGDSEYVGGYYGDTAGRQGIAEALDVPVELVPENEYEYMDMS